MKILRYILLIIMLLFTISSFISTDNYKFLFTQSSGIGLTSIIRPNLYLVTILFLSFALISFISFSYKTKLPILLLIFSVWLLSGRTVAWICCPEEKIVTGWFLMKTNEDIVCYNDQETDCEAISYYETHAQKLPYWRVGIKNKQQNITFFTGPFIQQQVLVLLEQEYPPHQTD